MSERDNLDCPPDRIMFLDPSQLVRSDLSALPIEEVLGAQGDINRMFELMHRHQIPCVRAGRERSVGFALTLPADRTREEG